jgi:hypothetical protein
MVVHKVSKSKEVKEYRSFVLQGSSLGVNGLKFTKAAPGGAASSAAYKLFALANKDSKYAAHKGAVIQLIIRETTRGSAGKSYAYDARMEKLDVPVVFAVKDGKEQVRTHVVSVRSLKEHEVKGGLSM